MGKVSFTVLFDEDVCPEDTLNNAVICINEVRNQGATVHNIKTDFSEFDLPENNKGRRAPK